jgi:glycosyltransferase involved in cell wall biosynthesis
MDRVATNNSNAIEISVVVPVRNEEDSIRALLQGLLTQSLPPREIVITDGGSTDLTVDIVQEFIQGGAPVKLIREKRSMPGRARNLAIAAASSKWIALIDAGVEPERMWLESLARKAAADVDVVYGNYEPVAENLFKLCTVMASVAPPSQVDGRLVRPRSIASALMKRSVWQAVGGFPEDLRSAEDLLFMNKIERANYRVVTAPDALVHWQVQRTIWGSFRRFIEYARNNMRAGLWRNWQAAVFKRYGLLLVSALPAIFLGGKWLLVTVLLWLALLVARALVAIRRNRECYPVGFFQQLMRAIVLVPIFAMLDAATFLGTAQWMLADKLYVSKHSESILQ